MKLIHFAAGIVFCSALATAQNPVLVNGASQATQNGDQYRLGDRTLQAEWTVDNGAVGTLHITDKLHARTLQLPLAFEVLFKDGHVVTAKNVVADGVPTKKVLEAEAKASRYSDRVSGIAFEVPLKSSGGEGLSLL